MKNKQPLYSAQIFTGISTITFVALIQHELNPIWYTIYGVFGVLSVILFVIVTFMNLALEK